MSWLAWGPMVLHSSVCISIQNGPTSISESVPGSSFKEELVISEMNGGDGLMERMPLVPWTQRCNG